MERESKNSRMKTEYIVLVLCMCVTVPLFCLPIVFYFVTPYLDTVTTDQVLVINTTNNTNNCDGADSILWGIIERGGGSDVECVEYTESVCLLYLKEWNQCLFPDQTKLITSIDSVDKLMMLERQLASIEALLDSFPDCQSVTVPFLCHYYFPLTSIHNCDLPSPSSIDLYTVTQDECNNIRDGVCAAPWQLAIQFGFQQSLPDCSSLPFTDINDTNSSNDNTLSSSTDNSTGLNTTSSFSCREDFIAVNNTCFPRCDKFSLYSDKSTFVLMFTEVSCGVFTAVVSAITFTVAIYQRKRMFKFPSFLFLLVLMDLFVGDFIVVLLSMDRYALSCSSISLVEAIEDPTPFCTIGGIVYFYALTNLIFWWFFHVCYFAYEVHFPFHARRMRALDRTKYIAIIIVILGFTLPLPGMVFIPLLSTGRHYRMTRSPPSICTLDEQTLFYAFYLTITVMACICTCLLISVLWIIHTKFSSNTTNKSFVLTTAEKKILIVFIYISGFTVFVITADTVLTGNSSAIQTELTNYFLCELTGHEPGKCNREEFEKLLHPELTILIYITIALIPVIILNFITNIERYVQRLVTNCKYRIQYSTSKSTSTS